MYGTWSRDPGRSLVLPQIVTGRGFDSRQVQWAKAREDNRLHLARKGDAVAYAGGHDNVKAVRPTQKGRLCRGA